MYGLGAQRHQISLVESYRRQVSGPRTLLEQAAKAKQPKNGESGPLVLHKHQHDDEHTHHHYPSDSHGEPDGDEVIVKPARSAKPETEGRRRM